jgi:two-component system chemotaxis sensor kinase CheA
MNPLLPLFLEETQELVERASRDLVALEGIALAGRAHDDAVGTLDGVFRSFHTLKGAAALFEFTPMTNLLHAAEDVLGEARERRASLGRPLIDALLACLDDVSSWLPAIEKTEALPASAAAQAERSAAALARLRASGAVREAPPAVQNDGRPSMTWTQSLSESELALLRRCVTAPRERLMAIAYDPDPRCFYRGDDPLGLFRRLPGLLLLRLEGDAPPDLDRLVDPFTCWLRLRAIALGVPEAVEAVFRLAGRQVCIEPLSLPPEKPAPKASDQEPRFDTLLAALLEEQTALQAADLPAEIREATRAAAARVTEAARRATGMAARGEAAAVQQPAAAAAPARMLRVAPERVERIIGLAGEAVVVRNGLRHLSAQAEAQGAGHAWALRLRAQGASLDRLVRDWHEAAARLRMVPIADIFGRFPRLVRDLAQQLGRDVQLVLSGETLEADRDVLELLFDPLVHLVRNSLDHGIESPRDRGRAGKPPTATLTLRAQRRADTLVIDVEDDGRGLDLEALRRQAGTRGLADHQSAAGLSDQAAAELIFLPGLSTASAVSTVSGRGVGMDAVRSTVVAAGGSVSLDSRAGQGLCVSLFLPMQASITRIMTIDAGGTRFGVPLDAVTRIMPVPQARILTLPAEGGAGQRRAFALDDQLIPLIDLAPLLELPAEASSGTVQALLADTADGPAALAVGGLGGSAEVILRPLPGQMAGMAFYLGTALLGDGGVLLVLDVQALLR